MFYRPVIATPLWLQWIHSSTGPSHSFSFSLQVVNLLLFRVLSPARARLGFGAQNANTIKCWVIALT